MIDDGSSVDDDARIVEEIDCGGAKDTMAGWLEGRDLRTDSTTLAVTEVWEKEHTCRSIDPKLYTTESRPVDCCILYDMMTSHGRVTVVGIYNRISLRDRDLGQSKLQIFYVELSVKIFHEDGTYVHRAHIHCSI